MLEVVSAQNKGQLITIIFFEQRAKWARQVNLKDSVFFE